MDAPSVAVAWSLGFAWVSGVKLPLWVPILLVLTVWSVYVADRVLDARGELRGRAAHAATPATETCGWGPQGLQERHYFHWRHRRILVPLAGAAACGAAWMVFRLMPVVARERNSMLAAAALVYFTRVHAGHRPAPVLPQVLSKELLVGVLFTCGCVLPALSRAPFWPVILPAAFFIPLAWVNCRAIDHWEGASPPLDPYSIVATAGAIGVSGLAMAAVLCSWEPRAAAMIAAGAVSALLLAWLDGKRGRLAPVTLRAAADLVLLMPGLLVALAWAGR